MSYNPDYKSKLKYEKYEDYQDVLNQENVEFVYNPKYSDKIGPVQKIKPRDISRNHINLDNYK